ncbi:hypothetical protein J6590_080069 [Homalodisca vitripennis]|nr:hypothetical protein J6590_080069 [Homalodisca vitripennis]
MPLTDREFYSRTLSNQCHEVAREASFSLRRHTSVPTTSERFIRVLPKGRMLTARLAQGLAASPALS